ncbi:MAG: ABC transporter permease [Alphaproteobacteria bacterium]|nr:MAG: ABC transporter permease [Alphaproteobacteria bacterium]
MKSLFASAWVVGRRDYIATVVSRSFLIFLIAPLLIMGLSFGMGSATSKMAREDFRRNVAVIASEAQFAPIAAARDRLNPSFGEHALPDLTRFDPDYDVSAQVQDLLAARDKRISAVLSGTPEKLKLTGAIDEEGTIFQQVRLILDDVRTRETLSRAHVAVTPVPLEVVKVEKSAGSIASERAATARMGQLLLFMVTMLLAGMLLSNLIEEKSNKVIEVLAAAIPIDAIFLGKLVAMLVVSLTGIAVWTGAAIAGLSIWPTGGSLPEPAVGWPLFVILVLLYYSANFLILGSLFLSIGAQASSVREVQTISMPVTIGQVLIFFAASFAVGPFNSLFGIAAAIFPFSSPMAMLARAAQTPELWPHLAALAWQALWVAIIVKLGSDLFRRNVMKSGVGGTTVRRNLRARA